MAPSGPSAYMEAMQSLAERKTQTRVGISLAALIVAAFLSLHVLAVFVLPWGGAALLAAIVLVPVLTWLSVGLFIVAHDAMHGSLAPGRPGLNLFWGRLTLLLYAGFWMDRLSPKHFDHHRHVGTDRDPDFSTAHPTRFWPWYWSFMRRYFGWREALVITAVVWTYVLLLGADVRNVLLFWALPAILSSLQLFTFGTFLPHRHEERPFDDHHLARTNDYGWLASLLTCFHFGYHHEHHLSPHTPWWGLPRVRRAQRARLLAA